MILPNKSVELSDTKKAVIANSVATNAFPLSIGDAIQPAATGHNQFVVPAASSGLIVGIVVGLEFASKPAEVNSVVGVNTASTTAGANQINTHTDNETTGLWKVIYIPSHVPMEYKADVTPGTVGITDAAGFAFFNLLGASLVAGLAGTLDGSAVVGLFGGTAGQFASYGVSTESASKVVGYIYKGF